MEQITLITSENNNNVRQARIRSGKWLITMLYSWVLLLLALITASAFLCKNAIWAQSVLPVLSSSSQILASVAFFSHAVVKYGERREARWLGTAAAFAAIGGSAGTILIVQSLNLSSGYEAFARILQAIGIIGLACAGMARRRLSRSGSNAIFVGALLFAAAIVIFRDIIGPVLIIAGYTSWAGDLALATGIFGASVLVAVCHGRRYVADADRLAGLLALWGITAAVATAVGWASPLISSRIMWQSGALNTLASLILVAGLGVENGMAQKEAGERLEGLECLHTISWFLVGTSNLVSLLTAFGQALCERLEAKFATVYLQSDDGNSLTACAVYGLDEPERWMGASYSLLPQPRRGFHSGHTARAYATREIQVVDDIFSDVEFLPWQIVADSNGRVVSVPLLDGYRVLGVVNLYFDVSRPIAGSLLRLLQTITAAATPAIKNAYTAPKDTAHTESDVVAA